jgi:hypothetical protein
LLREDYGALQLVATLQGETLIRVLLAVVFLAVVVGCSEAEKVEDAGDWISKYGAVEGANLRRAKSTEVIHAANGYFVGSGRLPIDP